MNYQLNVDGNDLQAIWTGLNELPAKFANPVMARLREQIEAQEKAAQEAARPKPEPTEAQPNAG